MRNFYPAEFLRRISVTFKGEKQTFPGTIIRFSFFELEQATDRFSDANLIGQGASSNVFRGKLFDGRIAAVKKLKVLNETEEDSGFLTEVKKKYIYIYKYFSMDIFPTII